MDTSTNNTPNPLTLESLANACQQLQNQFNNAQAQIAGLTNELTSTRNELATTQSNVISGQSYSSPLLKPKKPEPFKGKSSVRSWITHLSNYIGNEQDPRALSIAVSYLEGAAHE